MDSLYEVLDKAMGDADVLELSNCTLKRRIASVNDEDLKCISIDDRQGNSLLWADEDGVVGLY